MADDEKAGAGVEEAETGLPCVCGSGRPPQDCHEMSPRRAWAARLELQALGEAHDAGPFFPSVRLEPGAADALLDAAAAWLGPERGLSARMHRAVEGVVARLDEDVLRGPSLGWRARYGQRWRALERLVRDPRALERCFAASAVLGGILDRLPFDPRLAEAVEDMPATMHPAGILALVIDPILVWDRDDATLALEALPARVAGPLWVAETYAPHLVTEAHRERVRARVANVAAALPLSGRPRGSAVLARAVARVEQDEEDQAAVACLSLELYALRLAHLETERRARAGAGRSWRTWEQGVRRARR